ncbi:MFS general substrate transporter [Polyporus arcularius HHB13444]|uniref:MFS general substrate transporter n=1 Tax=Polyporus arcularius HHB13444 TaxID=1314778 RepID=A0A5C3PPE0_9APHY|nr:MFS general substrate transporter [Polyporus arcularius HHB13444]
MSSSDRDQEAIEVADEKSISHFEYAPAVLDVASRDAPPHLAKLWRKLDLLVLPIISIIYFLFSLDRYSIGNARVAGMQNALHITDEQYSIALTAQLLPQMLVQIPSNHMLIVVGPRIVMPSMILCGGVVCALQGFMTNFAGLVTCRFFMGFFQGGLLPGVSLYLASFYPRRKLQLRIAIMHSALACASAFSGLLSAAIIHMDGIANKPGWAWIFLLEGLFIVVIALLAFFLLPDSPTTALSFKDSEKALIADALQEDGILVQGAARGRFWTEFRLIFTQPHIILLVLVDMFYDSTLSSLGTFLPSIVTSLGYEDSVAQLMTVPPFAVSGVLAILTALVADRYAVRGMTMIILGTMATIGFALFLGKSAFLSYDNGVRYGSLFLIVPGVFCIGPPLGAWIANNTAPLVRRATALALASTIRNIGSILSMWLFGSISAPPRYTSASITLLVFQVGTVVCVAGALVHVWRENKRKARRRIEWRASQGMTGEPPREVPVRNESIWFEYVM